MGDPLDGLNPEQRAAATAVRGPVCILAGPGTGKTRTITHRIAEQVRCGAFPAQAILALTFTDRAAAELRGRLAGLGLPGSVRAATFHAAAWAQLRWFWADWQQAPLPEVLASKAPLLAAAASRRGVEVRDLASEIEWAKARALPPAAYAEAARASGRDTPLDPDDLAAVYRTYEEDKQARGLLDYDDMLGLCATMMDEHAGIAATVRERYRAFTVDELQDVNPAQWRLLQAWLGGSRELCVVGDPDQMIYAFTGASATYLTGFGRTYPEATVVRLRRSYRSTPEILALAERALRAPGEQSRRLTATRAAGPAPVLRGFATDEDERTAVVERVRALLASGVPPGAIAVCYRVNSQAEPLAEAFGAAGVPVAVRGEGGFYERREVRQALRALRAAGDGPAEPGPPAPGGALPASPPAADRLVARVLRQQMAWDPDREPSGAAARERWRNLAAIVDAVARMVRADPAVGYRAAVEELTRRATGDGADRDAVALLTLHRTKGLEFDAVFLVALEEGLVPISHARTDEDVAEERRLLYVGMTRARRVLWLSWAAERTGWGGRAVTRRPSRFLYGLGPGAPQRARAASAGRARDRGGSPQVPASPLAEDLRAWRRERAAADGVPAYVVFSDRTLADLLERLPASRADLLAVHGFGRARVERYGEEVLTLLGQR